MFFSNNTAAGFTNNCSTEGVYTWDFGDGTPKSNAVSPSHAYSSSGNYTITLDAVTPCGVGVRYSRTICVEPVLLPNFTFGNVAPITLVWSDGSTAGTERNNLGPGGYSVTITDKKGCVIN